ncbi:MAG: hypothetical protein COV74_04420 [Candidatus Omnitrophica bacterium CG11_big_fil_rev_8_21_14_0_20_45_26]|uniref:Peptidase S11 D-alanyl-D-alanine carboxypeptidase A N-terminal domain-containing protein n=1 Tax=Candidatus Abzuiibacterium crystallinum TaxID=1974748 RepID=A0A2H0LQA6_9BACT|nr:MAG: hypothetical protein COV74_04420 [Candidatus Omnitrophica bacterium CG11_big_fil_rev_8_21_14_0_20_45_26]PIW64273.1 MAG: hypothetical protein COW12_06940 [Candidatus Omnitrophica bacterium CG12_big_fil_rev_8_21_14_0_65_45_16]
MMLSHKKNLCIWLVILLALSGIPESHAAYLSTVTAESALVIDAQSGRVLFSRYPHTKRAPASTAKLLTALVILDDFDLNDVVVIPEAATHVTPTVIGLRAGERYYVRDMLRAILINSANDAATAMAIASAGSESHFAAKMNRKARHLGAADSNFVRASGLPAKNQYSTASDLMKIFRAAEKNNFIMKTAAIKTLNIRSLTGRVVTLKNHNKMLWRDSREMVGKTGWTRRAGHCFVGKLSAGSESIFVSILKSERAWNDMAFFADRYLGPRSQPGIVGRYSVNDIQRALKNAGYFDLEPTGFFGPITKRSVIEFQKAHQLSADGIVGPKTWHVLSQYL